MLSRPHRMRRSEDIREVLRHGRRFNAGAIAVVGIMGSERGPRSGPRSAGRSGERSAGSGSGEGSLAQGADEADARPEERAAPDGFSGGCDQGRATQEGGKDALGGGPRIAVIAAKGFRNASERHKALRRIRHAVRSLVPRLAEGRYVVVVRPEASGRAYAELAGEIERGMRKIGGLRSSTAATRTKARSAGTLGRLGLRKARSPRT
jgi:ribonuclease P protein component